MLPTTNKSFILALNKMKQKGYGSVTIMPFEVFKGGEKQRQLRLMALASKPGFRSRLIIPDKLFPGSLYALARFENHIVKVLETSESLDILLLQCRYNGYDAVRRPGNGFRINVLGLDT